MFRLRDERLPSAAALLVDVFKLSLEDDDELDVVAVESVRCLFVEGCADDVLRLAVFFLALLLELLLLLWLTLSKCISIARETSLSARCSRARKCLSVMLLPITAFNISTSLSLIL